MKITKSQLREIIREEVGRLNEADRDFPGFTEMKFTDLEKEDQKLGWKISDVVKPGATPSKVLDGFGKNDNEVVFAFMNPVRLSPSQLQQLSKLAKNVVIKDRYTYIVT